MVLLVEVLVQQAGGPGFAGGIAGSVIGGVFDAVIKAALELGKAPENPTKNLQALTNQLPIAGTATKGLIEQLNEEAVSSLLHLSLL